MYINDYEIYLTSVKNRSAKTVTEYSNDLKQFMGYVGKEEKDITIQDGRAFMVYLDNNGISAKSRARKVSSIRGYFKFLSQEMGIDSNILNLEKPKVEKTLPKYLTLDECQKLLTVSNEGEFAERDHCIITLFLNCGLRLSELANLKMTDISRETLVIMGKGSKERTVYLNDSCMVSLKRYLKVRDSVSEWLFVNKSGQHLEQPGIQCMVKKNLTKIGRQDLSTHKLRHSCATMYYEMGADLLELKELLGHESVATTQIYTHICDEKLKTMVANSPLSA